MGATNCCERGAESMSRQYLINWRTQRNESQQFVADSIGISRQYYSLIEDGSRQQRMDIALASKIAEHFGVETEAVVREEIGWTGQT